MRRSALSCLFALAVALHGESITSSTPLIIGGFSLARGGISEGSIELVAGALEFDPARRPRDAREFAERVARDLAAGISPGHKLGASI